MDSRVTDTTPENQKKWKNLLRRLLASVLMLLGILSFAVVLYMQFEGHADFWELSLIEMLFWGAFLFLSARLYTQSKQSGTSVRRMLYLPFRNLGIVLVAELLIIVVAMVFLTEAEFEEWFWKYDFTQENQDQAIHLSIVLLCIYLADRTLRKSTPARLTGTESEATEN